MYHVALLLLRDVDDYDFLPKTYQSFMPRTEDRSADFAPADLHTRDGIPRLRISSVYVSTFSFQAYSSNIIPRTWYDLMRTTIMNTRWYIFFSTYVR